jgi:hypothetical protein
MRIAWDRKNVGKINKISHRADVTPLIYTNFSRDVLDKRKIKDWGFRIRG